MANPRLVDYIKQARTEGQSDEQIRKSLRDAGWPMNDIEAAFAATGSAPVPASSLTAILSAQTTTKLLSALELLKLAWQDYKSRWKLFVGIGLMVVVFQGLTTLWGRFLQPRIGAESGVEALPPLFLLLSINISLLFLSQLLDYIFSIAIIFAASDEEGRYTTRGAYKAALRSFFPYFWVSILSGLVMIGGTLLAIIPGFIVSVFISTAIYVVLFENIRGMGALLQSYAYVRGRFLPVLWRMFFGVLLVAGLLAVPIVLFGTVGAGFLAPLIVGIALAVRDLQSVVELVLSMPIFFVLVPLIVTYFYRLYRNLKETSVGPEVSKRTKTAFVVMAVLGFLAIPALIVLGFMPFLLRQRLGKELKLPEDLPQSLLESPLETATPINVTVTKLSDREWDDQRLRDLRSLSSLIDLYRVQGGLSVTLAPLNTCADENEKTIFVSLPSPQILPEPPPGWKWQISPTPQNIDGTGWVPIDFTKLPAGELLKRLPIDPVNSAALPRGKRLFYAYVCHRLGRQFELSANMESAHHARGGEGDVESKDFGSWPYVYEEGTNRTLIPGIGTSDIYYLP